jgi:hypothetical protein
MRGGVARDAESREAAGGGMDLEVVGDELSQLPTCVFQRKESLNARSLRSSWA